MPSWLAHDLPSRSLAQFLIVLHIIHAYCRSVASEEDFLAVFTSVNAAAHAITHLHSLNKHLGVAIFNEQPAKQTIIFT